MMGIVCASIFRFFAVFATVHVISGQCTQSSCTERCYPNLWERDLCNFYREVSSWRTSAEQCGLTLPDPPLRSTLLSPQVQWDQARVYWDQLRSAWQQAAVANGVPGVSTTQPEDGGSGSPPGGMDPDPGSGYTTLQPTLGPSTPPTVTTQGSQLPQWLTSIASWENDIVQWESFARSESGLQLPDSTVTDVVARFNNSVQATVVRENSAAWFSLLINWRQGYDTYTGTFSGLCPRL